MALEIKTIPTLYGSEAERFVAAANMAEQEAAHRQPKDRSVQHNQLMAILKKANML